MAGVQDVVDDAILLEHGGKDFRLFDGCRADKDRLALGIRLFDGADDAIVFLFGGAIDLIMFVDPGDGAVRWNLDHAKAVDFHEFFRLGLGGACHPGQLFVKAEVVLEGHAGERHVFRLDRDAFLRLDRLMQPFRKAAAAHHAAGEFVDQHHFAVADDVLLILVEQLVRLERLGHVVNQRRAFGIVERLAFGQQAVFLQQLFDMFVTVIGIGDGTGLFVDLVILFPQEGDQGIHPLIQVAAILRGAGNDEGGARLVDQDRVDLVHDGEEVAALGHVFLRHLHVVAKIVEAQFVVCGIGDVGAIGGALFGIGLIWIDDTAGQAKLGIDLAHPFRVALCKVVVHGDDMHALACQRV